MKYIIELRLKGALPMQPDNLHIAQRRVDVVDFMIRSVGDKD